MKSKNNKIMMLILLYDCRISISINGYRVLLRFIITPNVKGIKIVNLFPLEDLNLVEFA